MRVVDYTVRLRFDTHFDTVIVRTDLAEASAPILIVDEEGETTYTGYQTADARHRERDMARLAVMSLGREYWGGPSAGDIEDEEAYVDRLIVSVTRAAP